MNAIAATEGVDVVFVGPGDLSVSLDAYRPDGAAKLSKAIDKVIQTTLKHGKASGIFCGRPEDVGRWAGKGASFFILASDTMFLGAATAAELDAARVGLKPAKRKQAAKH